MIKNSLDNPIFLLTILILAVISNLIASVHFLLVLFGGIIFTAFYRTLKKRYYYLFFLVIVAFLFIETNSGLKPFSLSLLSFFIYIFIIPRYESNSLSSFVYVIFFYLGLTIMWFLSFGLDERIIFTLIINLFIDLLFFGVFL
ncbi:hypothetical protein [Aliarcobacter butzleri]|uniref:hypothetical protein n=1 Tax=Aliarcobacter butzleri TaxID=28197 RepID=UPI001EE08214|nr:hypothetical protein [Aliarcobacter butzleri]MCG3680034.1 hypothetical protein [Aliarcobacter butzleri]